MKKIWVVLGLITFFLIVAYLYSKGIIKVSWEAMSAILAGLGGPFLYLQNKFKDNKMAKLNQTLQHQADLTDETNVLRYQYEAELKKRDLKIQQLQAQLEKLQDQLDQLKLEKQQVAQQVNDMTIDEKRQQIINNFGS